MNLFHRSLILFFSVVWSVPSVPKLPRKIKSKIFWFLSLIFCWRIKHKLFVMWGGVFYLLHVLDVVLDCSPPFWTGLEALHWCGGRGHRCWLPWTSWSYPLQSFRFRLPSEHGRQDCTTHSWEDRDTWCLWGRGSWFHCQRSWGLRLYRCLKKDSQS